MKIWDKVKYPMITTLIVLSILALRIVLPAMSYSWRFLLFFRAILVLLSRDLFNADWVLWDLILLITMVWVIMVIPSFREHRKTRRFLLRPLLAVLVFVLATPLATNAVEAAQTALRERERQEYQEMMDATYHDIEAFMEVADEAIAYNTHSHHLDDRFREAFPELLLETVHIIDDQRKTVYYYSDYMLIDYDTQRIGFIYHQYGTLKFFEYQLLPADSYPTTGRQRTIELKKSDATLTTYHPDPTLTQYTDGFALALADGSIYSIAGLCDHDNLFLDIKNASFEFLEDFPS